MKTISTEQKVWTIFEIISVSTEYLKSRGIEGARLNAELLLAHVLGYRRIDLYTHFDEALDELEREKYKELLRRRAAREPLQYILGEAEFMGLRFFVDRRVLIPRPETEVLAEKTIELCKSYGEGGEAIRVLDIGTGCGNIAVTVAKSVSNAIVTAIDVSSDALEVAMHNAELHGVSERVTFKQVDVLSSPSSLADQAFDIVVSNPPYISKEEFEQLPPEIRDYEARFATCDESDGLKFFRRISELGSSMLRKGGDLLFEVGYGQSEDVERIMSSAGYNQVEVFKDLSGIERVLRGKLK